MKNRYQVKPCDDLGTIEGAKRDRSWDVIDTTTGSVVSNHTARILARHEAKGLNNEAACGCVQEQSQ